MSGLAEVLAAHVFTMYPGELVCDCDWTAKDDVTRAGDSRMIAAHTEHLAAAALAWVAERFAAEGTREAVGGALTAQLVCYTLPANYGAPLHGETHEDVARRCGPLEATAAIDAIAGVLGIEVGE